VKVARETQFAKAETTKNHQNFQAILVSKDTEFEQLSETVAAIKDEGRHTKTVQCLLLNERSQRKTRVERNQQIKDMKTDLQNLLDTKQRDTAVLTAYLKQNQELRAERSAATDEVARLQGDLERRKKFISTLQKIIEAQTTDVESSCNERCIPEAAVKRMMADAVLEYYVEKEKALADLLGVQKEHEDLRSKYNICEDEPFNIESKKSSDKARHDGLHLRLLCSSRTSSSCKSSSKCAISTFMPLGTPMRRASKSYMSYQR
jgi:septal ring factor EnvC (AmiA/AmiB activator)